MVTRGHATPALSSPRASGDTGRKKNEIVVPLSVCRLGARYEVARRHAVPILDFEYCINDMMPCGHGYQFFTLITTSKKSAWWYRTTTRYARRVVSWSTHTCSHALPSCTQHCEAAHRARGLGGRSRMARNHRGDCACIDHGGQAVQLAQPVTNQATSLSEASRSPPAARCSLCGCTTRHFCDKCIVTDNSPCRRSAPPLPAPPMVAARMSSQAMGSWLESQAGFGSRTAIVARRAPETHLRRRRRCRRHALPPGTPCQTASSIGRDPSEEWLTGLNPLRPKRKKKKRRGQ